MAKKHNEFVTGLFSKKEDEFIKNNHSSMSDKSIGIALNRKEKSITNRRTKLKIGTRKNKPKITEKHREAYVATLDDTDRRKFFEKEVSSSASFQTIKASVSDHEAAFYIEKYIDFMMDPTVETMTAMEKDALHQLLIAEIRVNRHMAEEKEWIKMIDDWDIDKDGKPPAPISRAKEIRECQELILKCQQSLNVERKQRLKNANDQSMTFTNLIKEMKNPQTRHMMGVEATMLKVITERFYNKKLDKNIFSGHGKRFDLAQNFRNGDVPELPEEFMDAVKPEEKENE